MATISDVNKNHFFCLIIFLSKLPTATLFLVWFIYFPGDGSNHLGYCFLPSFIPVVILPLTSELIEAFFNGQHIEANCHFFTFFYNSCINNTLALEEFLINVRKYRRALMEGIPVLTEDMIHDFRAEGTVCGRTSANFCSHTFRIQDPAGNLHYCCCFCSREHLLVFWPLRFIQSNSSAHS